MAESKPKSPSPGGPAPTKSPFNVSSLSQIDFRLALVILRAHIFPALGIIIVVCSMVAWREMRLPKMYSAESAILVESPDHPMDPKENFETFYVSDMQLSTDLEQMKSIDVVQRVVASFTPEQKRLILAPYLKDRPFPANPDPMLEGMVNGATVDRKGKTFLVTITVDQRNPDAAALIANQYADQIISYMYERSGASNDASLAFLKKQADDLKQRIETEEEGLQSYRQKENLVSLADNQNIVVDTLKALNGSATQARIARLAVESRLNQAEEILKNNKDVAQLASIAEFSALTDVQGKIDDLTEKRAVLGQRYGRNHPLMQENQRDLDSLTKVRDDQIQAALVNLRNQLDQAKSVESQLASQLAAAEQESLRLDKLGVEYNVMQRSVDTDRTTYSQILSRLNDATITAQLQSVKMRVAERAMPPEAPYSPNPRKTMLSTLSLAVIILFGYPFTIELLFGRVRSWNDVEFHLGVPLLGEIGSVGRKISQIERPHIVEKGRDETITEQFRALYSQLQISSKIDPPKTILITSTVPGEGKSFIASNLASAFVAHGRKVLLVDCDLRRPSQHRSFGLPNKSGILRWIEEGGKPGEDLLSDERLGITAVSPGLFLLCTAGSSRRACELMESGTLFELMEALKTKFDVIILDTPPAGVFPDALAFARVAQEVIYICRFNTVSRNQSRNVINRLRQTGLEIPGVVLNAMPSGRGTSYYYYNYGYHSRYYTKYYHKRKEA